MHAHTHTTHQVLADERTPDPTALLCASAAAALAGYPGGAVAREARALGACAALTRIVSRSGGGGGGGGSGCGAGGAGGGGGGALAVNHAVQDSTFV
jgi:hypothetical protein